MHHISPFLLPLLYILLFSNSTYAIFGGTSVQSSGQYPFSVTLTNPILCGGSIISLDPPYILTAAHCIENFNINDGTQPSVLFGDRNFSRQAQARIKRVITHPLYISASTKVYVADRTDTTPYDIGLIELSNPLVANIQVNRIRLYTDNTYDDLDANNNEDKDTTTSVGNLDILETIGMGYRGINEPHADLLQYTECTLSNTTTLHGNNFNNSIILATSNAGLCHGDSGSPLLYKPLNNNNPTEYYLKGVLNRVLNAYDPDPENTSCPLRETNTSEFINLFVKPSSQINWITEVTGLSKSALIDPVIPSNNSNLFSSSSSLSTNAAGSLHGLNGDVDLMILLLLVAIPLSSFLIM